MSLNTVKFRLLEVRDFEAVVRIDEKVLSVSRKDYYREKFETCVQSTDHLPVSIVAGGKWNGGGVYSGGTFHRRIWNIPGQCHTGHHRR